MVKAVKGLYLRVYLFPYPPIHPLIDLSYTGSDWQPMVARRWLNRRTGRIIRLPTLIQAPRPKPCRILGPNHLSLLKASSQLVAKMATRPCLCQDRHESVGMLFRLPLTSLLTNTTSMHCGDQRWPAAKPNRSHSISLSLYLTRSLSPLTVTLSLCHSVTHSLTHSLAPSRSLTLTVSLTHSHSLTHHHSLTQAGTNYSKQSKASFCHHSPPTTTTGTAATITTTGTTTTTTVTLLLLYITYHYRAKPLCMLSRNVGRASR